MHPTTRQAVPIYDIIPSLVRIGILHNRGWFGVVKIFPVHVFLSIYSIYHCMQGIITGEQSLVSFDLRAESILSSRPTVRSLFSNVSVLNVQSAYDAYFSEGSKVNQE